MLTQDEKDALARSYLAWARWLVKRDLMGTNRGLAMLNREPCAVDDIVDLAFVRALSNWDAMAGSSFGSFLAYKIRYEVCNRLRRKAGMNRLRRHNIDEPLSDPRRGKFHSEVAGRCAPDPPWMLVEDDGPGIVDATDATDHLVITSPRRIASVFRELAAGHTHAEIAERLGLSKKQVQNAIYDSRPVIQSRWETISGGKVA
jgi:DNA-directed RNA polymerase specialized sigma24 family protein